ncbi:MAG: DNA internalization-related competence protein ComEC/Rec2 [Firmicutes bacterium]|nr:DNA internalization-related competence protein ComEC/Rec2 [Bacillota bacterium]
MRRPIVAWCAAMAAGSGLAVVLDWPPAAWAAAAAGLSAGVLASLGRGRFSSAAVFTLIAVCGALWTAYREATLEQGLDPFVEAGPVLLRGTVAGIPEMDGDRVHVPVRVESVQKGGRTARVRATVRVSLPAEVAVRYGDELAVRTVLRRPAPARNPGAFDYRAYLRRQGITAIASVRYARHAVFTGVNRGNPAIRYAAAVRELIRSGLRAMLAPREAAVSEAVALGNRRGMPEDVETAFRRAGVSHLLAVSGLHVAFVAAAGWRLLSLVRAPRWANLAITAALVWMYVLASGARPPAVRAGVAGTLALAAPVVGRQRDTVTGLALAALILLIHNPLVLTDASFQLSFAATGAIVAAHDPLRHLLRKLPRPLASLAAVTVAAQLGVAPLLAYTFQEVSLVGLVASLVGGPLTALLVPGALVGGLLYHVWPQAAAVFAIPLGWLVTCLVEFNELLARLPWALIEVRRPWEGTVAFWWAAGLLLAQGGRMTVVQRRGIGWACALAAVWGLWVPILNPPPGLEMIVFDVGQGDAVFLRTPSGATALVDGGGSRWSGDEEVFNGGRDVIIPYLQREGIRRIDVVVVTHPHTDHLAGIVPVLAGRRVGLAVDGGQPAPVPAWEEYVRLLDSRGVPRWIAQPGDIIRLDDETTLEVLHAPARLDGPEYGRSLNDYSVVVRVRYGRTAALLTGDLDVAGQWQLLTSGRDVKADVVKVPHHGSRLSLVSDFYEAVGARLAVISVGPNNYGQPHPEVLAALEESGAQVFRTDVHGAVKLWTDGTTWSVEPTLSDDDPTATFGSWP